LHFLDLVRIVPCALDDSLHDEPLDVPGVWRLQFLDWRYAKQRNAVDSFRGVLLEWYAF